MQVDVDGVEANEEIDESLFLRIGDMGEKRRLDSISRGERLADSDRKAESLCIDIADIDTTLVSEKNFVALASRVNADVEFSVGRVGEEGLDNECAEGARDRLDLYWNAETLLETAR